MLNTLGSISEEKIYAHPNNEIIQATSFICYILKENSVG